MGWGGAGRVGGPLGRSVDGSGESHESLSWGGAERVGGLSCRFGTGCRTLGEARTGQGNLWKVQDRSGNPRGGAGRVKGLSRRSETGRGTLGKVRDE